jgi:FkbM family methyltransferase
MLIKKLRYAKYYGGVLFRNWRSKKESFAQHGEDLLIEQLLEKVESFIDIGANDGVLFSNTYKFAKSGARGLCLEPSPSTFFKLRLNHLFHPRIKCVRAAVSNRRGTLPFIEDGYEAILSRVADAEHQQSNELSVSPPTIDVPALTLDQILSKHERFQQTDLLSIDVEGHERQILEGMNDSSFRARFIILEIDKSDVEEVLSLPALKSYVPRFTNGVNLILAHESEPTPSSSFVPIVENFLPY